MWLENRIKTKLNHSREKWSVFVKYKYAGTIGWTNQHYQHFSNYIFRYLLQISERYYMEIFFSFFV